MHDGRTALRQKTQHERNIVMTIARWQQPDFWNASPLRRITTLRDELDQLFGHVVDRFLETPGDGNRGTQFLGGWLPPVDIYEDKDNLTVKAELPGMKKEDIGISLHDGYLTLSGERKQEKNYQDADASRSERLLGRFQRTVNLPCQVNTEDIKATYTDGVLTVVLPKAEEAKPKQIPISVK
jgi:HSP20 family protein